MKGTSINVAFYSKRTKKVLSGQLIDDMNLGIKYFKIYPYKDFIYALTYVEWVKKAFLRNDETTKISLLKKHSVLSNI